MSTRGLWRASPMAQAGLGLAAYTVPPTCPQSASRCRFIYSEIKSLCFKSLLHFLPCDFSLRLSEALKFGIFGPRKKDASCPKRAGTPGLRGVGGGALQFRWMRGRRHNPARHPVGTVGPPGVRGPRLSSEGFQAETRVAIFPTGTQPWLLGGQAPEGLCLSLTSLRPVPRVTSPYLPPKGTSEPRAKAGVPVFFPAQKGKSVGFSLESPRQHFLWGWQETHGAKT